MRAHVKSSRAASRASRGSGHTSVLARRSRLVGLAFVAPGLIIYAFVVLWPLVQSVQFSFYNWDGVGTATWAGFKNYTDFFSDPMLRSSLVHVLILMLFFAILPIILGLISANLVSRSKQPGMAVYRWLLFLPQVITSVVIAIIWRRIYAPDGPLNEALRAVGLGSLAKSWLGDFTWALPAVGMIGTWVTFGFCMVLFVSGASSIPNELYEAAKMDGAGPVREFFTVTLPGLRGQLAVALTLTITAALRTFDLVWVTTRGGPGTSTVTPAVVLYRNAFQNPRVGMAAAIGVVMAVLCLVIALVITRVSERED